MRDPVRVGVVGAGAIAQVAHLGALSRSSDAAIVGICDIDVPKARALATRFGVPNVYDDIEDLLEYARPEAVVICTPNHLHEVHVITALSAGAHVLCERPLALTADGVERVRKARTRSDGVLMVGMNMRYRSDVQAVRQFLVGEELGPLRAIRAGWYVFNPFGAATTWRRRRAESGGGAMLDLGLPLVDLALWIASCPRIEAVSAAFAGTGVEDAGCAFLRCANGLNVIVDVSWRYVGSRERFWFDVMGGVGSASLAPFDVYKEINGMPMKVTPDAAGAQDDPFTGSYRAEWLEFLAVVRGERERPSLDEQVTLHRTMEAIGLAAREGHDVTL